MFAKLFGEGDNQVLVTKDQTEDGDPCIKFTVDGGVTVPGLALVALSAIFRDDEEKRDAKFDALTEADVLKTRDGIIADLKGIGETEIDEGDDTEELDEVD